jgi:threonine dehydrogenase-like Zn-dependent dehydrogenase
MGQLAAQVLALASCDLMMIGKHPEKLALAEQRSIATSLLDDADQLLKKTGRRVDIVVECSGAPQGLELALQLVRPRGTILLKSTVADKSALHLAPIVIDEIRVQGSRCGPFAPALRALDQKLVDVGLLVSERYTLDEGLTAFQRAGQKGVLKVLVRM